MHEADVHVSRRGAYPQRLQAGPGLVNEGHRGHKLRRTGDVSTFSFVRGQYPPCIRPSTVSLCRSGGCRGCPHSSRRVR